MDQNVQVTRKTDLKEGLTLDSDYVPRVDPLPLQMVPKKASLPLFALVRNPDQPSRAWICKLGEGPDCATYSMIAEGEWLKLSEDIDYLHAGEEALHGPR